MSILGTALLSSVALFFCFLVFFVPCLSAQQKTESAQVAQAVAVAHPPKLDGTLDDPMWKLPEPVTNFAQREPYEGQPPTERTEVCILYTKGEIYFGIFCFDSESRKIVATQVRRDISQELDDYFEIVIDSSHNRRNSYVFQFNPLGTQRDALITDEQSSQDDGSDGDLGWDGTDFADADVDTQQFNSTPYELFFPEKRQFFLENTGIFNFAMGWHCFVNRGAGGVA